MARARSGGPVGHTGDRSPWVHVVPPPGHAPRSMPSARDKTPLGGGGSNVDDDANVAVANVDGGRRIIREGGE